MNLRFEPHFVETLETQEVQRQRVQLILGDPVFFDSDGHQVGDHEGSGQWVFQNRILADAFNSVLNGYEPAKYDRRLQLL